MRLPYFVVFQIFSLVMALVYLKHLRKFALQVMVPLLILVCIIEVTATNTSPNIHIYNFYLFVSPVFYAYLFIRTLQLKFHWKKIYIVVSIILGTFFIWDYYNSGWDKLIFYTMLVSMISYLILSCVLLFQMVSDDTRNLRLTKEPYFWIAAGLIVFSVVTIVITGLHSYIVENKIQIAGKNIQRVIMPMINVVLYSCFAYSFYLCKRSSVNPIKHGS